MEEYSYKIEHIEGKNNNIADLLSRIFTVRKKNETDTEVLNNTSITISSPLTSTQALELLTSNNTSLDNKQRIIIPERKSDELLASLHKELIHPGYRQFYYTVKDLLKIPNLNNRIKRICTSCLTCNKTKKLPSKHGTLSGGITSTYPNELVSTDIMGPIKTKHFNTSKHHQKFYILTMTDITTRFTELAIVFDITSETIVKMFTEKWIQKHGAPKYILSDQGRQYISTNFSQMLNKFKIQQKLTTPHNPTGNSISERINQTIGTVIRITRGESLARLEQNIYKRLNLVTNRTTGKTPYELWYKQDILGIKTNLNFDWKSLNEKSLKATKLNERKRNKKRICYEFKIGNLVFKKNHSPDKGDDIWLGPFKILDVDLNGNWIKIDEGTKTSKQNVKNVRPIKEGGVCGALEAPHYRTDPRFPEILTPISGNTKVFKQMGTGTHASLPHASPSTASRSQRQQHQ
jgi:transposase InsO family protein